MDKSQAERELLSVIIAESLRDEIVTVGALADRAARHGFGLLMIVLSLPAMFPVLPPGLPALVGLLFVIVATQMLIGLERPWLPGGLALSAGVVAGGVIGAEKLVALLEWFFRRL